MLNEERIFFNSLISWYCDTLSAYVSLVVAMVSKLGTPLKKSRIGETKNIPTNAESSTSAKKL